MLKQDIEENFRLNYADRIIIYAAICHFDFNSDKFLDLSPDYVGLERHIHQMEDELLNTVVAEFDLE
jgi:hypothetical protein